MVKPDRKTSADTETPEIETSDGAKDTPETEQPKYPVLSTQGPAQMSLPELLSYIMLNAMKDKTQMPAMRRDLTLWYHAQDPGKKQETARLTKRELEVARSVMESIFQEFMYLAHMDF